ncbi:MAG: hypothetical protein HY903_16345 [Deltaproteobacteria bacterium]|nr:hypothetical protein [Deltaproteobacteria bacterium]
MRRRQRHSLPSADFNRILDAVERVDVEARRLRDDSLTLAVEHLHLRLEGYRPRSRRPVNEAVALASDLAADLHAHFGFSQAKARARAVAVVPGGPFAVTAEAIRQFEKKRRRG